MQAPEPSPGSRKQDIHRQALKRTTPLERAAFLDGACGGDAALRVEIEALLAISIATASWTPAQATAPASPKPSGAHPPHMFPLCRICRDHYFAAIGNVRMPEFPGV